MATSAGQHDDRAGPAATAVPVATATTAARAVADAAVGARADDPVRRRGTQVTRLEAFTDAAFAFTLTLLMVAAGTPPTSVDELLADLRGLPAFVASFAIVAFFWTAHYQWSRRYGLETPTAVALSLAAVLLVLAWVYPLRMIFAAMFHWLSGGALAADFAVAATRDLTAIYVTYGTGFAALSLVLSLLYAHALARADELALTDRERIATRGYAVEWLAIALVAVLSIVLAVAVPPRGGFGAAVPGFAYFLIGPAVFACEAWSARRRRAIASKPPG